MNRQKPLRLQFYYNSDIVTGEVVVSILICNSCSIVEHEWTTDISIPLPTPSVKTIIVQAAMKIEDEYPDIVNAMKLEGFYAFTTRK